MMKKYYFTLFIGFCISSFSYAENAKPKPTKIDFNRQIKPILSDRCFKCHGPDKNKVEAGLQLTSFEAATALLKSGQRAIVPFKPNESELVKRIYATDPKEMMPMVKTNLSLNETEKKLLVQWIEQGAGYQEHWSFVSPTVFTPPSVKNTFWVKNPIDNFILNKIEEKDLKPNGEALKETLIRRVCLDLTGLPPTVQEVNEYLNDSKSNAYENLVDRLLSSPAYGERMALDWLDVARYADTHGYQDDGNRNAYPYRDWLIRAFNQNLTFNDFAKWQLAGDLLKNPTRDQLIATCFNRNHQQTQEGGVVDEEYRVEYVADRVNTFGKAFLGLTTECARCHTHKYDPITHNDYYSLFAFFNSNKEMGIIPYSGEASPTLVLKTDKSQKTLDSLYTLMKPYETKATVSDQYKADLMRWVGEQKSTLKSNEKDSKNLGILRGRVVHFDFEPSKDSLLWDDVNPPTKEEMDKRFKAAEEAKKDTTKKISPPEKLKGFWNKDTSKAIRGAALIGDKDRLPQIIDGKIGKGIHFQGESGVQLGRALDFEKNQPFSYSIWFRLTKEGESSFLFGKTNGEFEGHRGYLCRLNKDATLNFQLNHAYPANGIDLQTTDKIKVNEWTHIAMTYDGSSKAEGVHLFINGKKPNYKVVTDHLERSILHSAKPNYANWSYASFKMGIEFRETLQNADMDELQIWKRQLSDIEISQLAENQELIKPLLLKDKRSETDEKQLLQYYLLSGQNPSFNESIDSLIALRAQETNTMTDMEEVMIMREMDEPRTTFILNRGSYDAPSTTQVFPNTPVKILPFDTLKYPKNRLGLAEWLGDSKNPLFARVIANRYWQLLFGKGIVATQEDFGNQGALPSHPELLDWLAVDFRESNWDLKRFMKQIVMSSTYRQSSVPTAETKEKDFSNELYTRYPAQRLSAELVRDNALASSGLLVKKIGGASVYPYQPAGLWEALATRNETTYRQNHGDSLYRRSMYTIIKRSAPPPAMVNFDATDRAFCSVRRQKTASPLQSLVLMNDPQFVEASRILSEKMIKNTTPSVSERLQYGFQALTSRKAHPAELTALLDLYETEYTYFKKNLDKAEKLLSVGEYPRDKNLDMAEVAAYTVVASTVMNFDEFVMKR
jgi:Protein of unknown function (DUF1553)/Protein of unknown function (DUF1549)/Concanavalin A-like lectin/glucanases superfamily/Planctomycete cytochrome C